MCACIWQTVDAGMLQVHSTKLLDQDKVIHLTNRCVLLTACRQSDIIKAHMPASGNALFIDDGAHEHVLSATLCIALR